MNLLVVLILVGHGASGSSTVSPRAEKTKTKEITPLNNNTQNEKTKHEQEIIDKRQVNLPSDEIPKPGLHVISEELFERPKRERETDKDFLKNVVREFFSYDQFKQLVLRDRNAKKKGLQFGIQIGYNEKESASATHEKIPVDSVSEELNDGVRSALPKPRKRQKIYQKHYVLGRSKGVPEQADQEKDTSNFHSSKDYDTIKLLKNQKKYEKNNQNIKEGLSNMAMALVNYLKYSKIDENDKNLGNSKGSPINKEADMSKQNIIVRVPVSKDLVNHIISEIKLLLATHKDKSKLYVSRILDIITKKQEFLSSHPDQACREVNINYLIHSINTVYQKYLKNAVCEGEYVDTGLDLIGWISSNKKYIKAKRKSDLNKCEIDCNDENDTNNASKENRHESSSDSSSGEVRMSDSSENERKNKIKYIKSSLTSDDSANIMTKEFESDEDHEDPNKETLDLYIKSRLVRSLRTTIFHRSQPYYRNIEKVITKQDNANIVLESIHLVCEKIASEQFLHSVEAIIWKLLGNRDCKPKIPLKHEHYSINALKPLPIDTTKHQIEQTKSGAYSQESSEHDTANLNDSSNLSDGNSPTHNTEFDESSKDHEDYDIDNLLSLLKINLRSNHKHFPDLTHLRNDKLKNIFGSGKINSLKAIKQKLKNLNINDYKKLMENLPVAEKLLKLIYNKLPPQLQTVLTVLKTGATEIIGDKEISLTQIPSLLIQIFSKGKGKDLLKMMADKFEHERFKKVGKLSENFQDKTKLRGIVQSLTEFENNKKNDSNMVVNKDNLQEKHEPSPLDSLPHIEIPSSIEKKDQPVIELTYVFNHPPTMQYKPKFFIKHNITYDQYLKNIKSIYNNDLVSSGNQIQLVRVIKKEGNESQVFYETDITNAAVEASIKSSLLHLYNQLYNSTGNIDKNSLPLEKVNENYDTNKKPINEISKSIPTVELHSTINTVSPVVSSKQTTAFQSKDKLEVTVDSTSKNNTSSMKHDDSKSEEVFFDNAESAEVANIKNTKPHSSSYNREGIIQWNNYPIRKPKYNNRRKISRNHPKIRRPRN
ncbi:uncharacterized protein [Choristoneura fumiferana]|uniref:uncharacterized protein n=1 Tax=Choristoneura fumiferana TaxID=7141 RepID=UPI003D158E62